LTGTLTMLVGAGATESARLWIHSSSSHEPLTNPKRKLAFAVGGFLTIPAAVAVAGVTFAATVPAAFAFGAADATGLLDRLQQRFSARLSARG
jgi:hypothetical protein